ncbi:MAG: hypothetical protein LUG99_18635 [Lachnospiraceae bacterium]|nr:hypothetical protein [Lachnospiraceae bacterium]
MDPMNEYINKWELLKYLGGLRYCDIVDSPEKMFNPDTLIFGMISLIRKFPAEPMPQAEKN